MGTMNRLMTIASALLVGFGILSLGAYFVLGWTLNVTWPLVVIMLGVAFYILAGALAKERAWADLLYIPGSVLLALGVIFLINIITGDWNAWAYAWLLGVAGLAWGVILASHKLRWRREVSQIGIGTIVVAITGFVLFGAIAGGRFILVASPILLVLGGLALRWLRPEMILPEQLLQRFRPASAPATGLAPAAPAQDELVEPLSARELEVLRLVDQGLSNPQIAEKLSVAPSTVKTHINNIYGKLAAQTRVQALKRARELGLLSQ